MLIRAQHALLRARIEAGAVNLLSEEDDAVTAENVINREELLRARGLGLMLHVLTKPIARRYVLFFR
jgi:hypothetical protein